MRERPRKYPSRSSARTARRRAGEAHARRRRPALGKGVSSRASRATSVPLGAQRAAPSRRRRCRRRSRPRARTGLEAPPAQLRDVARASAGRGGCGGAPERKHRNGNSAPGRRGDPPSREEVLAIARAPWHDEDRPTAAVLEAHEAVFRSRRADAQARRERRRRRRLEKVRGRDLDAPRDRQRRQHVDRGKGVAAEIEEVVVDPDPVEAQGIAEGARRRAASAGSAGSRNGRRDRRPRFPERGKRPAVELARRRAR